ncbi:3-oxoacyl-(acyl-carrier-protein) synthase [Streptosporangium album]|uniref:3-oxoacyl-(Acyl-carrier-protein) synthase n=1 Tax=Streptosporangium album TaxID=47479 RepID=A0A7W7RS98_9ACTN|nr:SDR family NAD(P)-dependent oxidoreductase [Streptosporangium album]MBB4937266.1 3-oxoacyl-(acyl-carrier-protein) synthase [Streptosporangium album]
MSVAIVGLACTYPDAPDPGTLWETVMWRRRAFRRLPSERLDLADHHSPDRSAPDRTYSDRAALIEGWEFDRAAYGVPEPVYRVTDPAHWLALDTASRALADAGLPGGEGLDRDRVTVVVGATAAGENARGATLRLRWPYVRHVLASALAGTPAETAARVLASAEAEYLRPFPETSGESLAGGLPATIASRVCAHFDLRGGGYTVDGGCASSLLAVITACRSLLDGSADFALAGGVDLGLGPFELVGLAKAGALAGERMRIYDTRSDGLWPGEGCGIVALTRTADARAAGLRIYAEIAGWGVSCDGGGGDVDRSDADGWLMALRRAYAQAGVSPAEVALFEGAGTAVCDTAELTALTRLLFEAVRQAEPGAPQPAATGPGAVRRAAIGSVTANVGHTRAAAGVAGLIKTALSIASGVLPPTTGCGDPHRLLTVPGTPLRVLAAAEPWPAGHRHAGVSAMEPGGVNAHLVLTASGPVGSGARLAAPETAPARRAADRPSREEPLVFAFSGQDARAVRAALERVADQAARWSEAELCDLAYALGNAPAGPARVAIVAGSAEQLAERAGIALERQTITEPGGGTASPGIHVGPADPDQGAPPLTGRGAGTDHLHDGGTVPAGLSPAETAALWAAMAIEDLTPLYGGQPARPMDIWRDRLFIAGPCPPVPHGAAAGGHAGGPDREEADAGPVAGVARWVRCFAADPVTGAGGPLTLDATGPLPVGPGDVVLVSGGGEGIGFACAMALAEASGCALALLGRQEPDHDVVLAGNLKELSGKEIRYGYAAARVSEAEQAAHAVRELESTLGPVTIVIHAAGAGGPDRSAGPGAEGLERYGSSSLTGLDNLLAATTPRRVVTFGRYGPAGDPVRERVAGIGGLNVDWPVWAGTDPQEPSDAAGLPAGAGGTAITPQEGVELFLALLRTGDLPSGVAVHGRLDGPVAPCPEGGRFLGEVRVHVPGVELVADSRLSLRSDTYLNDHRIDGRAVLPAVVALEAMAQAAGALAGRPLDEAGQMTFDRPVVVPDRGGTTIRVCALRHGQTVEVVVRSEETGFRVDHFRAVFPVEPADETLAVPQLNRDGSEPLGAGDLYGALCFHTGRFQRVRELTLVEARGCRGELHGDDPDGWFAGRPVLGSPGLSDATIHALQACVPHRRLLPVGGERLVVRPSQGDVRLHAAERHHDGGEYVWDVTATDVRGRLVAAWTGLRLRDVGPLPRRDPWPPNLLAVYLQRAAVALGLDPALHVTMDGGTSRSRLGDLVLGVDGPAYCSWTRVGEVREPLGAASAPLADELLTCCGESAEAVGARVWTAARCLSKAGLPPATPLAVVGGPEGGWLLLRAGADLIASTVVQVRGVAEPVAVSIMTGERR